MTSKVNAVNEMGIEKSVAKFDHTFGFPRKNSDGPHHGLIDFQLCCQKIQVQPKIYV